VAKDSQVLLEIDIQPAEHDLRLGDVLLVGGGRHVGRQEDRVEATSPQGPHQGVVVQAAAADATAGSGGNVHDPHR